MYTSFFGLSDIPFSIAPNPEYLFLGDRHKEALAHLSYGLGDTGGFALLTGEVGTGKTTLSRRLLEQLPENTQVAFILNPTLSCIELLATICDELKVRYKKTGVTLKYLTDKIQQKLLKNHEDGVNTLLIIDEAQHLQPEVLEQLRLLTNLETNTKKLLQVVLIGQPELQQLLQRRDLRQLAQRITARYHLLPLTAAEVESYIKHRLNVADCHRSLFKPSAIKLIHKISKGIPRLINLLCDRALATAYGNNDSMVSRKTVLVASAQALGSEYQLTPWWKNKVIVAASVVTNIAVIVGIAYWLGTNQIGSADKTNLTNTTDKPVSEVVVESVANDLDNEAVQEEASVVENKSSTDESLTSDTVNIDKLKQELKQELREEFSQEMSVEASQQQPLTAQRNNMPETAKNEIAFDTSQLEGVSPDLLAQVQQAIEETDDESIEQQEVEHAEIPSLMDMPMYIQNRVPSLQFEVHIYATEGDGWVRVNGRERYEGDTIAGDVKLARIMQDKVILELDGEQFSLPALSAW